MVENQSHQRTRVLYLFDSQEAEFAIEIIETFEAIGLANFYMLDVRTEFFLIQFKIAIQLCDGVCGGFLSRTVNYLESQLISISGILEEQNLPKLFLGEKSTRGEYIGLLKFHFGSRSKMGHFQKQQIQFHLIEFLGRTEKYSYLRDLKFGRKVNEVGVIFGNPLRSYSEKVCEGLQSIGIKTKLTNYETVKLSSLKSYHLVLGFLEDKKSRDFFASFLSGSGTVFLDYCENGPHFQFRQWIDFCAREKVFISESDFLDNVYGWFGAGNFVISGEAAVSWIKNYTSPRPKVLLSYTGQDRDFALNLRSELSRRNFEVIDYRDSNSIFIGSRWREQIAEEMEKIDFFIPLVSSGYLESGNCRDELEKAISLSESGSLMIFPIKIQEDQLENLGPLKEINYARFWEYDGFSSLVDRIEEHLPD